MAGVALHRSPSGSWFSQRFVLAGVEGVGRCPQTKRLVLRCLQSKDRKLTWTKKMINPFGGKEKD